MKILFVIVDGGGNIPPQLAVARALRDRGAQICFLGHAGVRERVEAAGFSFEPFTAGHHFDPTVRRPLLATMADFARTAMDRQLGYCAVQAARRHGVDAIVIDVAAHRRYFRSAEIRHSDGGLRALFLSGRSGSCVGSDRTAAASAGHSAARCRTKRSAADRQCAGGPRPDARRGARTPRRCRMARRSEGGCHNADPTGSGQPQHMCVRRRSDACCKTFSMHSRRCLCRRR